MKKLHIIFLVCLTGVNIVTATGSNDGDDTEITNAPLNQGDENTTIKEVQTSKVPVPVIVSKTSSNTTTSIKDTGNTESVTEAPLKNTGGQDGGTSTNVTNSITSKSISNGNDTKPIIEFHEITKAPLSKDDEHTTIKNVETSMVVPVNVTEASSNTGSKVSSTNTTSNKDKDKTESVTETPPNRKTTKDNSSSILEHVTDSKPSKTDSTMAPKTSTVSTAAQTTVSRVDDSEGTGNEKPVGNNDKDHVEVQDQDHVEVQAIEGGRHPQKINENEKNYTPEADSPSSGHFMGYLLTAIILCVAGYVVFHNKQKIIAFIVEGRSGRQRRRTGNGVEYKKLHSNVEEVMPSLDQSAASKHFIY